MSLDSLGCTVSPWLLSWLLSSSRYLVLAFASDNIFSTSFRFKMFSDLFGERTWIAEGMKKEPVQTAPRLTLIQLIRRTAFSLKG